MAARRRWTRWRRCRVLAAAAPAPCRRRSWRRDESPRARRAGRLGGAGARVAAHGAAVGRGDRRCARVVARTIRLVRVGAAKDDGGSAVLDRTVPDADVLGPALASRTVAPSASAVRLLRGAPVAADSAFARAGGVVVRWDSIGDAQCVASGGRDGRRRGGGVAGAGDSRASRDRARALGGRRDCSDGAADRRRVRARGRHRRARCRRPAAAPILSAYRARTHRRVRARPRCVLGRCSTPARSRGSIGAGGAATGSALASAAERPSPIVPWLLGLALACALAELALRARAGAGGGMTARERLLALRRMLLGVRGARARSSARAWRSSPSRVARIGAPAEWRGSSSSAALASCVRSLCTAALPARSLERVALWVEERHPSLRYALVTAVEANVTGDGWNDRRWPRLVGRRSVERCSARWPPIARTGWWRSRSRFAPRLGRARGVGRARCITTGASRRGARRGSVRGSSRDVEPPGYSGRATQRGWTIPRAWTRSWAAA